MPNPTSSARRRVRPAIVCVLATFTLNACSVRQYAMNQAADAMASQGNSFASDDDPELIRSAAPFSLKLIESFIAQRPAHPGLSLAATRGFTQYAYAFVQQDADEIEDKDIDAAYRLRERAAKLYRRARDYGLQGLTKTTLTALRADPAQASKSFEREDAGLLYWTGAAWAGWISLSKDNSEAVADLPAAMALLDRALALDESYDHGALHTLFITLETSRQGNPEKAAERARAHFQRAIQLSGGKLAGPYVAFAESVALPKQDKKAFTELLNAAIQIDPNTAPENRLENLIIQKRARWLLERTDKLFME